MALNEYKQPFWDASSECYDPLADYYDTLLGIVGLPVPRFYEDLITDRTGSVLELGSGTGIITQALANRIWNSTPAWLESGSSESTHRLKCSV